MSWRWDASWTLFWGLLSPSFEHVSKSLWLEQSLGSLVIMFLLPSPLSYPHLNSEAFEALICVCLWRPRPPKTASGLEYFLWAVFSPTLNSLPGIFQTWEVRAPVQRGQALSQAQMTGVFLFRCCCLSKWQGWAQGSPRPSALATWCSWLWPISQT